MVWASNILCLPVSFSIDLSLDVPHVFILSLEVSCIIIPSSPLTAIGIYYYTKLLLYLSDYVAFEPGLILLKVSFC